MTRRVRRISATAVAALTASFAAWLYVGIWLPAGGGREVVRFTVHSRDSAREVARELKQAGLIRSPRAFRLAASWRDGWRRVRTGDYALRRDMSACDILRLLESGAVMEEWITVPEGFTVWQMAQLVEAKGLGSSDAFLRAVGALGDFQAGFPLPADSLEGYLFPDTYRVGLAPEAPRKLAKMMLARFDEVVWRGLFGGSAAHSSLHDAITLASLVEAEAKAAAERPLIAAVLRNRLQRGMKLECDATVQYALGPGNHKGRLTYADLVTPSPYNTYLHAGLPPGPINSPGRASIAAALHPADVPYLFYVARPDGTHIFSRTYEEHLRAVARARAERRAQGPQ